jgi:hypothetical protein
MGKASGNQGDASHDNIRTDQTASYTGEKSRHERIAHEGMVHNGIKEFRHPDFSPLLRRIPLYGRQAGDLGLHS